jgi:hypothetical protein
LVSSAVYDPASATSPLIIVSEYAVAQVLLVLQISFTFNVKLWFLGTRQENSPSVLV